MGKGIALAVQDYRYFPDAVAPAGQANQRKSYIGPNGIGWGVRRPPAPHY